MTPDFWFLAATIYGEARGEPWQGKVAVAWVIQNRLKSRRWGNSYRSVVTAPKQFSCWNASDPNYAVIQRANLEDAVFQSCVAAGAAAHFDLCNDPTDGALHYAASYIRPKWATDDFVKIGHHHFYRGVNYGG